MSAETRVEPSVTFPICPECDRCERDYLTFCEAMEKCHPKGLLLEYARMFWVCNQCGVTDVRRSNG
jgi:Zn-dependent alcohol dehydrogenase